MKVTYGQVKKLKFREVEWKSYCKLSYV